MDETERLLVIILGSALAVLLMLAIFAIIRFIQVLRAVRHLTEKAESIGDAVKKTAGSLAAGKVVTNVLKAVLDNRSRKKGE